MGPLPAEAARPDDNLERIQAVTDAALAHLALEELLAELLDRARDVLSADTAAVLLMDPTGKRLVAVAARGLEEEVRQGVSIPIGQGFAGRIAATVRPVVLERVDHRNVLNPILREKGIISLLGVPLVVEGRVLGVLHVGTLRPRLFGEEDIELLQLVADRVALAVHARRAKEDRATAQALQRSLLPAALPAIFGLDLGARYAPGEGGSVGGDWYDVFVLPSGAVALVMGDVAGRGLDAAVVMARARSVVRAHSLTSEDPAEILGRLDEMMLYFEPEELATVFLGVLDPMLRTMTFSSAGHPAPVLAPAAGPAAFLEPARDVPIGATRTARRRNRVAEVPVGSTLYLYTDGLVERRELPLDRGLERLRSAALPTTAEVGCASILLSLVGNDQLDDDVALLAVHFRDLDAAPFHLTVPAQAARLKEVRSGLQRWLASRNVDEASTQQLLVAMTEACTNVVQHAYGAAGGSLEVEGDLEGDEVVLVVRDRGEWKPRRSSIGGRGLLLMERFADGIEVSSTGEGTEVRIRKRVGRATG